AGLVPFDPESVIIRPEVIELPPQLRLPQPDDLLPRIYDVKALEKDPYHLDKENTDSVDQKLELTSWVAHKAVEALGSKTVELAQQHLKYQSLDYKYKELQAKKGRKKVPPKRGRQLVEADDIVAKQNEWRRTNETPPSSRSLRSRMKK
ncbi:hypothetical protein D6C78_10896, partial [Aureobasidium pullulans]